MGVVSAAIVSKSRILLCRQFLPVTRARIEALLTQFITFVSEGGAATKSVTETDSARFLFVPEDDLYLVLVTDTNSNIIEDTSTLRLFQQVVVDCCLSQTATQTAGAAHVSEAVVLSNAFDIIFALDEMISVGGQKNNVDFAQIKEFLLMESEEEKIQMIIRKNMEDQEMQKRRKKAQELDRQRLRRAEAARTTAQRPTGTTGGATVGGLANMFASGMGLAASSSEAATGAAAAGFDMLRPLGTQMITAAYGPGSTGAEGTGTSGPRTVTITDSSAISSAGNYAGAGAGFGKSGMSLGRKR